MKIVMCYTVGDGYTFSCEVVNPLEYESPEQALVDFEKLCKAHFPKPWRERTFMFAGREYESSNFFFSSDECPEPTLFLPDFLTVDEWFEKHQARTTV